MHILPTETSPLLQNELALNNSLPYMPAITVKLASSQARKGRPDILTHAMRSELQLLLPKYSTQRNHFSQMLLLALKIVAALSDWNLIRICIPPIYLTSDTSYPSKASNDGKLHTVSKHLASPTKTSLPAQSLISFMHASSTTLGGGGGGGGGSGAVQ
ncbi:hypothetical protein LXL04_037508 [Taraxacum kok-saghyz]